MTPSCFEDKEASLSNYLKPGHRSLTVATWLLTSLLDAPPNVGRNVVVASKSGQLKPDQPNRWLWLCPSLFVNILQIHFIHCEVVCSDWAQNQNSNTNLHIVAVKKSWLVCKAKLYRGKFLAGKISPGLYWGKISPHQSISYMHYSWTLGEVKYPKKNCFRDNLSLNSSLGALLHHRTNFPVESMTMPP